MRSPLLLAGILLLASSPSAPAKDAPRPVDRAAVDACLQKQKDKPESCIGTIYDACTSDAGGSTTMGMNQCAQRELAVWQERMEVNLRTLLAGPLAKVDAKPENRPVEDKREHAVPGSEIIKDMQRAWLAARAKICDTETLHYEGGTLASVIYGQCLYEEVGRHALWLKALTDETHEKDR
jgi:uncharacterized protein YecT (DUF1311 family)